MSVVPNTLVDTKVRQSSRLALWRERLFVLGFVLLLLLITAVPYVYGYLSAPAGRVFQGIVFNVADISQYWSWMRDHRTALMVPNRMTPEPNDPALFNTLWLTLGQIQQVTGWSEPVMYQILRIVGGGAFLLTLWWFIGLLVAERSKRWVTYLVATLGGGLGWIWVVEKYVNGLTDVRFPLDLYVVEPNTLFALLTLPHFLVAAALLLATFGCFLLAERQNDDWRGYALSTTWALLLGVQHAYDLLMIYFILGAYVLLQFIKARRILWRRFWGLAAVGFLSFPPAGYFTFLTTQNPLWREILAQFSNAGVFTPNLLHIPILLGITFIITIIYGINRLRQAGKTIFAPDDPATPAPLFNTQFLWVWAIVGFGLLYIPADFQIHMLNPYQVPLALLATHALWQWTATRRNTKTDAQDNQTTKSRWSLLKSRQFLAILLILAVLPTNLYLLSWRIIDLRRAEVPFYLSQDEVTVLDWLEERSSEQAVVFSGMEIGQYVPALTGHRAFLSHWAMTVGFFEKREAVKAFYDSATPAEDRYQLLDRYDVQYVVYGIEERTLGEQHSNAGSFDPATDTRFEEVFTTAEVVVFEVERE